MKIDNVIRPGVWNLTAPTSEEPQPPKRQTTPRSSVTFFVGYTLEPSRNGRAVRPYVRCALFPTRLHDLPLTLGMPLEKVDPLTPDLMRPRIAFCKMFEREYERRDNGIIDAERSLSRARVYYEQAYDIPDGYRIAWPDGYFAPDSPVYDPEVVAP